MEGENEIYESDCRHSSKVPAGIGDRNGVEKKVRKIISQNQKFQRTDIKSNFFKI